jgi:NADH dehydrogenase FAD-containing subunit
VQKHALKGLTTLGVDIKFNTRVVGTTTLPTGQTEATFSDGSKSITDLYVPTYGFVPNSSHIPSKFLSSKDFVIVDDYLKAKGVGDVWAIGDVVGIKWKQWIFMDQQSSYVAKNIILVLRTKAPIPYKVTPAQPI